MDVTFHSNDIFVKLYLASEVQYEVHVNTDSQSLAVWFIAFLLYSCVNPDNTEAGIRFKKFV